MDKIYEQQSRKEKKREEEEEQEEDEAEESTWGCFAHPDGAGSSKHERKSPPGRECPGSPFTLRKMT